MIKYSSEKHWKANNTGTILKTKNKIKSDTERKQETAYVYEGDAETREPGDTRQTIYTGDQGLSCIPFLLILTVLLASPWSHLSVHDLFLFLSCAW